MTKKETVALLSCALIMVSLGRPMTAAADPPPAAKAAPKKAVKPQSPGNQLDFGTAASMTVEDRDNNFTVELPDNWITTNLDRESLKKSNEQLRKKNPSMASMFSDEAADLVAKGTKLLAFESSVDSVSNGYAPNLMIVVTPLFMRVDSQQLARVNVAAMKGQHGVEGVDGPTPFLLAAGMGSSLTMKLRMKTLTGADLLVESRQVYFCRGLRAYVINLSSTAEDWQKRKKLLTHIMESFNLLNKNQEVEKQEWKVYTISNSGVKILLPARPKVVPAANVPVDYGDRYFIGRYMVYVCSAGDVHFIIAVGFYKKGSPLKVQKVFFKKTGRDAIVGFMKGVSGVLGKGGYTIIETKVRKKGSKRNTVLPEISLTHGDQTMTAVSSMYAADSVVTMVTVFYPQGDKKASKDALKALSHWHYEFAALSAIRHLISGSKLSGGINTIQWHDPGSNLDPPNAHPGRP